MRRLFINQKSIDLEAIGLVVARVGISSSAMDEEYLNAKDVVAMIQTKLDEIAVSMIEQPEGFDQTAASAAWTELNILKKAIVEGNI